MRKIMILQERCAKTEMEKILPITFHTIISKEGSAADFYNEMAKHETHFLAPNAKLKPGQRSLPALYNNGKASGLQQIPAAARPVSFGKWKRQRGALYTNRYGTRASPLL